MTASIESITTAALSAALDAASHRHGLLAANIAHANTRGYAPVHASFDAHLEQARATLADKGVLDAGALEDLRQLVVETAPEGSPVQLDAEMAQLARNSVQQHALTTGLVRHLSLLALAAGDGRK